MWTSLCCDCPVALVLAPPQKATLDWSLIVSVRAIFSMASPEIEHTYTLFSCRMRFILCTLSLLILFVKLPPNWKVIWFSKRSALQVRERRPVWCNIIFCPTFWFRPQGWGGKNFIIVAKNQGMWKVSLRVRYLMHQLLLHLSIHFSFDFWENCEYRMRRKCC